MQTKRRPRELQSAGGDECGPGGRLAAWAQLCPGPLLCEVGWDSSLRTLQPQRMWHKIAWTHCPVVNPRSIHLKTGAIRMPPKGKPGDLLPYSEHFGETGESRSQEGAFWHSRCRGVVGGRVRPWLGLPCQRSFCKTRRPERRTGLLLSLYGAFPTQ